MSTTAMKSRKKAVWGWAMYDWANSAYSTVITAAVLPPFFISYYAAGQPPDRVTSLYAGGISISLLVSALLIAL